MTNLQRLGAFLLILAAFEALAVPPTCTIAAAGDGSATLNWVPPTTDENGNPLTLTPTYVIFRGTTSGGETQLATGVVAPPYVDTGLTAGTYYYYVKASDSLGYSPPGGEVCKTFPPPPAPPAAPTATTVK